MSKGGSNALLQLKKRSDIQRKVNMANKRLEKLERNNLTDMSAYRNFMEHGGGVKFSVGGKDYNQLQSEISRVNKFLDNKTSLVRQANKELKSIASRIGMKSARVKDLAPQLKQFFELASKIEQYFRNVEGSASAIGYQKIWEVINEYVAQEKIDFEDALENYGQSQIDMVHLMGMEFVEDWLKDSSFWTLV